MPRRFQGDHALPRSMKFKKKTAGQKALKKVNKILKGIEHKYHDRRIDIDDITYNGSILLLDAVPQGDGDSLRDGDSLFWKNMSIRLNMFSVADCIIRVIVFLAKDPLITSVTRFLQNVGDEEAPFSPREHDYMRNGKTLYDRTFVLDTAKTLAVDITKFVPINKKCQFNAASTTVNMNGLKLILISNVIGPSILPSVRGWIRTTYTDN